MAAATAAVFHAMMFSTPGVMLAVCLPTLFVGLIWALLLRNPRTVRPGSTFRVAWLWSIPLAAFNSGLAAGLMMVLEAQSGYLQRFFGGFLLGISVGATIWIPAMLLVLLLLGGPIAWSQRLAAKGLAGAERGEGIVGGVVASASIAALAYVFGLPAAKELFGFIGLLLTQASAVLGVLVGLAALTLAAARTRGRQAFVKRVEAGNEPLFRVESTDEGKVLYRVVSQGEGYRVADYEEEFATLDAQGEVTRGTRVVG